MKQLAGGCMCCTLAGPMTAAVAMLLRQSRPDRLLVEASGLGHPAGLVDVLQADNFKTSVRLESIICLMDACQVWSSTCAAARCAHAQLLQRIGSPAMCHGDRHSSACKGCPIIRVHVHICPCEWCA